MKNRTHKLVGSLIRHVGSLMRGIVLVCLAACALVSGSAAADTNIVLHLDAAIFGSAVTGLATWQDMSGHAHDATMSTPEYRPNVVLNVKNSLPVVRLDANDFMTVSHTYTTGSGFIVAKYAGTTFGDHDGLYGSTGTGDSDIYWSGWSGSTGWYAPAGSGFQGAQYLNGTLTSTALTDPAAFNLYSGVDATPNSLSSWNIGRDRAYNQRNWEGDIAEVIIYDKALSDFDRMGVEVYLDEKWGLGLSLRTSYGAGNFSEDLYALGLVDPTRALHLDAARFDTAESDLQTWPDISGNDRDASGLSNPEVVLNEQNGLPVVRFDGNDYFTISDIYTAGAVFAVAQYNAVDGKFVGHDGLYGGTGGNATNIYFSGSENSSNWNAEAAGQMVGAKYDNGVLNNSVATLNQWNLFSGVDTTPQSLSKHNIGADRSDTFGGSRAWDGDIAEVIVYEEPLRDFDRKGVEVYLDEKWGLGLNLRSTYGAGNFSEELYALGLGAPTRVLHLDAARFDTAESDLETWPDISDNDHDATGYGDPEVVVNGQNGLPVVSLDGNDYFTVAHSYTTGTAFAVAKYDDTTFPGGGNTEGLYGAATGYGAAEQYWTGNGGGSATDWSNEAGGGFFSSKYRNGVLTGAALTDPAAFNLYSGVDATPNLCTSWRVGGDRAWTGSRAWTGDIAEFIVYEEALSAYDRKGVEVYLDEKWGLGNDLRTTYGAGNFNDNPYELGLSHEPTMIVRLDASILGATAGLATWHDRSGNGHAATQGAAANQPSVVAGVQNGLSVVRYDSTDFMTVAHTYVTGSAFIIAKYDHLSFSGHDGLYGAATGYGSAEQYWSGGDGGTTWGNESGGGFYSSKYLNGTLSNTALTSPSAFNLYSGVDATPNAFTSWAVGADRAFGAGRSWEGDIAEVIVYEEALSDYDRKGVEVYLDEKWGLGLGLRATYGTGNFNDDVYELGLWSRGTLFLFR